MKMECEDLEDKLNNINSIKVNWSFGLGLQDIMVVLCQQRVGRALGGGCTSQDKGEVCMPAPMCRCKQKNHQLRVQTTK